MHQVTFLISAQPPGCTFQLWIHFSNLWTSCQKCAPRIFDTSCINKFWLNLAPCIAGILQIKILLRAVRYFASLLLYLCTAIGRVNPYNQKNVVAVSIRNCPWNNMTSWWRGIPQENLDIWRHNSSKETSGIVQWLSTDLKSLHHKDIWDDMIVRIFND